MSEEKREFVRLRESVALLQARSALAAAGGRETLSLREWISRRMREAVREELESE